MTSQERFHKWQVEQLNALIDDLRDDAGIRMTPATRAFIQIALIFAYRNGTRDGEENAKAKAGKE